MHMHITFRMRGITIPVLLFKIDHHAAEARIMRLKLQAVGGTISVESGVHGALKSVGLTHLK